MLLYCTLALVCNEGHILLGLKRKGRVFGEYWNGPGGKIEKGESSIDALLRETFDECGLRPVEYALQTTANFLFRDQDLHVICDIYEVTKYEGKLVSESEEFSEFAWFPRDALPYEADKRSKGMLAADKIWLKQLLAREAIATNFLYDNRNDMNLLEWSY